MCEPDEVVTCTDEQFDRLVNDKNEHELLETTRKLQMAMSHQQELFNELKNMIVEPSSPDAVLLTDRMTQVQSSLTALMTRNMKCFIRQSEVDKQRILTMNASQETPSSINQEVSDEQRITDATRNASMDNTQLHSTSKTCPWKNKSPRHSANCEQSGNVVTPADSSGNYLIRSSYSYEEPTKTINRVSDQIQLELSPSPHTERGSGKVRDHQEQQQRAISTDHWIISSSSSGDESDVSAEHINFSDARKMFEVKNENSGVVHTCDEVRSKHTVVQQKSVDSGIVGDHNMVMTNEQRGHGDCKVTSDLHSISDTIQVPVVNSPCSYTASLSNLRLSVNENECHSKSDATDGSVTLVASSLDEWTDIADDVAVTPPVCHTSIKTQASITTKQDGYTSKESGITEMLCIQPVCDVVVEDDITEDGAAIVEEEDEGEDDDQDISLLDNGMHKATKVNIALIHEAPTTLNGHQQKSKVTFQDTNNVSLQGNITLDNETAKTFSSHESEHVGFVNHGNDPTDDDFGCTSDDRITDRVTLKNWDPSKLLEDLYKIQLMPADEELSSYVNMEGYMEKLPMNKKKATLLKTWKRRYFKACNGLLHYYEGTANDRSHGILQLMGGTVEDLHTSRMLGIDDGKGHYMLVRCPNEEDFQNWKRSLQSQTSGNVSATYVKPVSDSLPNQRKKVVILDIGSCSVRAGILREQPSLPDVFFPTVIAIDEATGVPIEVGCEAYKPQIRERGTLMHPVRPSSKGDKVSLAIDRMPAIIAKVFSDLKVDPAQYWVMFSAPSNLSDRIKGQLMALFIDSFHVRGVNIASQTLLAMYSYNATSGVVVDIGDRLDIIPLADGYIVKEGVTRQPYGGQRIADAFNSSLTERRYRFFTQVEHLIVRHAAEQLCYVADNYQETVKQCINNPSAFKKAIDLQKYDLPNESWTCVENEEGRFKSAEGMFDMDVWGMDNKPLHKLIYKAVQACPMDMRREMWRSIYLSGGATMLPGFVDRLHSELTKLVPPSIVIQIHASPQRYHAAYTGACTLASLAVFEQSSISAEQWHKQGTASLNKWHMF